MNKEVNTKLKTTKYGTGTVRTRKDGTFEARIYDSRVGKQVSVYGKTKSELNRNVRKKRDEILLKKKPVTNLIFREYADHWLRTYKYKSVKETTYDKHEQMLEQHVYPAIGHYKIKLITTDDIQTIFNALSKNKAYSTIEKVYEVLFQVFDHSFSVGDIEKNPMLRVVKPKEENLTVKTKEIMIYTDEELKLLYDTMIRAYNEKTKYRLAPLYLFLAHTGLRRGELVAAKWSSDVDFTKKQISISRTMTKVKNRDKVTLKALPGYHVIVTTPKTKSSIRKVPLNDMAIWCLKELQRRNMLEGINSDYICCNKDGEMISSRSFDQMLERLCKAAKVEFKGLHAFRHSFATRCFARGIEVKIVSKLLGHSSVNITYSTYIHVLKEQEIMAVEKLNDI